MDNKIKTHRCEESLKRELSIRYTKEFNSGLKVPSDTFAWRLFKPTFDFNYDSVYLEHITKIDYCPCCGEKLV